MPVKSDDIGIEGGIVPTCFKITKDVRNKYIISHLAWDLGILDYLAECL